MKKDASWLKKARLEEIKKRMAVIISGPAHKIDLNGLLNWVEMEIGLTRDKAQEYVNLICKVQGWDMFNGEITIVKEAPKK